MNIDKKLRNTFYDIKRRCNDPKTNNYHNYGGRGIKCLWNTFDEFKSDMGQSYKPSLSIDRIDNNGDYCKQNCRWATKKEQGNNRRACVYYTYKKKTLTVTQWAESIGIHPAALRTRLAKGICFEDAIKIPFKSRKKILYEGTTYTQRSLAFKLGMSVSALSFRLRNNIDITTAPHLVRRRDSIGRWSKSDYS